MVRLQATQRRGAAAVPTAAVHSLPLLWQDACARRAAYDGATIIHFSTQVLIGAISTAIVQPLSLLGRLRLLILVIQDVFGALSFNYLTLHLLYI